jgi:hypothetical protein
VALSGILSLSASARNPQEAVRALVWTLRRALPFLAGLLALYLLAWIGLVPDPAFPFDPALEHLGLGGRIGVLLALAVCAGCLHLLRPLRPPPAPAVAAAAPMAVTVAAGAVLLLWLANPYLALLLALGLNLWLLAAAPPISGRLAAGALVLAGLLPLLLAVGDLASRLDRGLEIVPSLVLFLTGGQIGLGTALLGCLLGGAGLAIAAAAGPAPSAPPPSIRVLGADRDERDGASQGPDRDAAEPPEEQRPQPDPSVYW